jgi:hypothetical protein
MKPSPLSIEEIKARLFIPDVWRLAQLPGEPGKSCASPFRPDKKPSFSVFDEGRRFRDHATGEGGDVLDFVAAALDVPPDAALKWAREQCGGVGQVPMPRPSAAKQGKAPSVSGNGVPSVTKYKASEQVPQDSGDAADGQSQQESAGGQGATGKAKPCPKLRRAKPGELEALAALRGYSLEMLAAAQECGLLAFANVWGRVAWMVCDPGGRIAEGRRLDGKPWEAYGSMPERKCHAWGGQKNWPVNLESAAQRPKLALVEGGPDALAALEIVQREGVAESVGVVAMLGAANTRFDVEALPYFRGKIIRIFCHADEVGRKAAREWARALVEAGAVRVDAFDLSELVRSDGQAGKDLNDLLNIAPECRAKWRKFQRGIMP